ncbi:MAG: hypothetical protein LUH10_15480 [Tannerellaceae bacterium]|nr:hypothetical protein [Tannerellaceae bacterium]
MLDSKQIFRTYQSKYYLTNWLNENGELAQSDGEVNWLYCGVDQDFRSEDVSRVINNIFTDDEIYLCISSSKSLLVLKPAAVKEIGAILHKKEIGIMNKSCTRIMYFSSFGVFKSGIIRDFPKSRSRPAGSPLKVSFHANIVDQSTEKIFDVIRNHFADFEKELYKDYGGSMEYLWIELELVQGKPSWPFRFQKRVALPDSYTEFYSYNVGHYSVKPDFQKLRELSSEQSICSYIFKLLYESTQILVDKQKNLNGFNASAFRFDFLSACKKSGYDLSEM